MQIIDATMPASGKTILTAGPGMLYGQKILAWPGDDDASTGDVRQARVDPTPAMLARPARDSIVHGAVCQLAQLQVIRRAMAAQPDLRDPAARSRRGGDDPESLIGVERRTARVVKKRQHGRLRRHLHFQPEVVERHGLRHASAHEAEV